MPSLEREKELHKLDLTILDGTYAVVRLSSQSEIPNWAYGGSFISITKTDDELSVVCNMESVPQNQVVELDWRIFKVMGPLDFSLTGILAGITQPLAGHGISIFAVSTYDTDYILVKNELLTNAIEILKNEGHQFTPR